MRIGWKKVKQLPPGKGHIIEGEGGICGRLFPFLWKFSNPWLYFKVDGPFPYCLYRSDGKECCEYKSVLYARYIAVRSGIEATCFMAVGTKNGNERKLTLVAKSSLSELIDDSVYKYL